MSSPAYGPELLARLRALCEADPGRESCGFVVRRGGALEIVHVPNVADRYHAADPARFPRTSRDSYLMDPRAQLRVHEELAASGGEVVAVWHSHVEDQAGVPWRPAVRADVPPARPVRPPRDPGDRGRGG